jgi:SAM-dependent methyltransferase
MDRKDHWEKIYRDKKPSEVSWFQREPARSLEWIQATTPSKDAGIIDIGGGASVLVDRLLDLGYRRISVLDISGAALGVTKERLGIRAGQVRFVEADVTQCNIDLTCDLWHDRAVFHFLTEAEDRKRYADLLMQSLRPGGHVILAAFATDGPEKCSGLIVRRYDAALVLGELGKEFRMIREEAEVHRTPAEKEQRFRYYLLQRTPKETVS